MSLINRKIVHIERAHLGSHDVAKEAIITVQEEVLSDRSKAYNVYAKIAGGAELVYFAADEIDAGRKVEALVKALQVFEVA